MASCDGCIHEKLCVIKAFPEAFENTKWEKEPCDHFKPTADVVEVKHGEWVTESRNGSEEVCRCSACNELLSFFGFYKAKYCSNCGAKMDGIPQKEV